MVWDYLKLSAALTFKVISGIVWEELEKKGDEKEEEGKKKTCRKPEDV